WALLNEAASPVILTIGLLIGLTAPQASSMVRSRWLLAIDAEVPATSRSRSTSAVLSYESMTDELMFVFGPVIVGISAVAWGTVSPVVGASLLTAIGIIAFALHPSADYAQGRTGKRAATGAVASASPLTDSFGTAAEPPASAAESPAAKAQPSASMAETPASTTEPSASAPVPSTAQGEAASGPDPVAMLFRAGVLLPVGGMVCIGLFFGSTLTSLTAFM